MVGEAGRAAVEREHDGQARERALARPRATAQEARPARVRRRPRRRRRRRGGRPAAVSTPVHVRARALDRHDARVRGAGRRPAAPARSTSAVDQAVQPAAHVPRAEGVLDVAGDGQRRRRPPRVGARVGGEALDDQPQPRVAHGGARQPAQRVPGAHPQEVARVRRRRTPARARPRRPRRRTGQVAAPRRATWRRRRRGSASSRRPRRATMPRAPRARSAGRRSARRRCGRRSGSG